MLCSLDITAAALFILFWHAVSGLYYILGISNCIDSPNNYQSLYTASTERWISGVLDANLSRNVWNRGTGFTNSSLPVLDQCFSYRRFSIHYINSILLLCVGTRGSTYSRNDCQKRHSSVITNKYRQLKPIRQTIVCLDKLSKQENNKLEELTRIMFPFPDIDWFRDRFW